MYCCLCFLPAWYIPVPAHFEVPPDLYLPGSGKQTAVSAGTADFVYSQTVCFSVYFFLMAAPLTVFSVQMSSGVSAHL